MNKIKILFNLGETFFAFQPIFPQIALSGLRVPMTDYQTEAPQILRDFLSYHETIKAHFGGCQRKDLILRLNFH